MNNTTPDQITCWNCEELIHRSVGLCPYCNKNPLSLPEISVHETSEEYGKTSDSCIAGASLEEINRRLSSISLDEPAAAPLSKIERLPSNFHKVEKRDERLVRSQKSEHIAPLAAGGGEEVSQAKNTLLALIGLVWGAFLLLFGLVLFSARGAGKLVLVWDAALYPYCLAGALLLLALGIKFYRK